MGGSPVIFCWPISSRHGWGIRGLGTALNWPGIAISALPQLDAELPPDDPRWPLLRERVQQSLNFQQEILGRSGQIVEIDCPVLVALGNDLTPTPGAYGRHLRGKPHIACPVFEDVESVERNIERLRKYDRVVVASRWNMEVLHSHGVEAALCHEGIDPLVFNPSVRKPRNDGKFRVFSGGKVEWRKAQDLVMLAFREFAETHDDAVLVAAWSSPFVSGADYVGKWEYGAPPGLHLGQANLRAWAQRVGIKPHQFELVPPLPNWRMAEVYGSCDVALFPNRKEGGTSFPTMECLACGVPTIWRGAYGLKDLGGPGQILTEQCSIDEIVVSLEAVYIASSSYFLTQWNDCWTWERHCREMSEIIANV